MLISNLGELPQDRPASFDEKGHRLKLYPAEVRGSFRSQRNLVHPLMIALFLLLPWVHFHGEQLLLLNVADRSFSFFGLFFRAHDAPLFFFFLLGFAITIAFVTAVWGRAWCGWACPQTVFGESVFRRIERWIEGDHRRRKALDQSAWSFAKAGKKALKWSLFLIISLIITHSFLAYFVGSREVAAMVVRPPHENWLSFLVIIFTTGIILFDFGWFREQFCVVMCPYGRFQSVLLDDHSLVVSYDPSRGEPRRGSVPEGATQGDCVNCYRCVQVCPTGIDIRRGLQLECIACTACIDACNEVMEKTKRPKGLIRHDSSSGLQGSPSRFWRTRTYIYLGIISVCAISLGTLLSLHKPVSAVIFRAKDAPYQIIALPNLPTLISNHFVLEVSNQSKTPAKVEIELAEILKDSGAEIVVPTALLTLAPKSQGRVDFFIRMPKAMILEGVLPIELVLKSNGVILRKQKVTVIGPQ